MTSVLWIEDDVVRHQGENLGKVVWSKNTKIKLIISKDKR